MRDLFSPEQRRDLIHRGFTRRDFARLAVLMTAGAALPFYNEATLAQGLSAGPRIPADAVKINANENPMGPCPEAIDAIRKLLPQGGRYLYHETSNFAEAIAQIEGLEPDHVMAFAGSSDPLHRVVLAFTGPEKSFVVADPGYEAGEKAAQFVGARTIKVPLRKDWSHDVRAMAAADPNAGVIYVCNPNNPTGSVTPKDEIEYLVNNKPRGAIVLLDEAYLHFSKTAEPGSPMVAAGKDVIILRTFSKLYGMAGLRAGVAIGRPDLIRKTRGFGINWNPVTSVSGAMASLKATNVIPERKRINADIRDNTIAFLKKRGFDVVPSVSNKFMVDTHKPTKDARAMLQKELVYVGRAWPSMPTYIRVSVGTAEEMKKFQDAFIKSFA